MPWAPDRVLPLMSRLAKPVREKATEIANALLEEGMEEGKSIRIATAKAKESARRRGP